MGYIYLAGVYYCDVKAGNPIYVNEELDRLFEFNQFVAYTRINSRIESDDVDLSIDGNDIQNFGFEGKQIGEVKNHLEEMVRTGQIENSYETLMGYISNLNW